MGYLALIALALVLTACGRSTPAGTASGLLGKAGATSDGPAYTVTSSDTQAECSNGATEADGSIQDGTKQAIR